ncbi:MAG: 3-keto-disaccharide hydrolase [Limisphaerales bacterium]
MKKILTLTGFVLSLTLLQAGSREVLFDGSNLDAWEYREGGWVLAKDGSLTCKMEKVKAKNGKVRVRGMGYIWTKKEYGDFELSLSYKLSEGANSGVFYRTDKDNPVNGGFEIQLMDNEGFQKTHGKKDAKKLNGSFYEGKAPSSNPANPVGEWNTFKLTCKGPRIRLAINGVQIIDVNVDDWDKAGMNPDGTKNKFKTALKDLPRTGRIGLQNHGQVVWFKDVVIKKL